MQPYVAGKMQLMCLKEEGPSLVSSTWLHVQIRDIAVGNHVTSQAISKINKSIYSGVQKRLEQDFAIHMKFIACMSSKYSLVRMEGKGTVSNQAK